MSFEFAGTVKRHATEFRKLLNRSPVPLAELHNLAEVIQALCDDEISTLKLKKELCDYISDSEAGDVAQRLVAQGWRCDAL